MTRDVATEWKPVADVAMAQQRAEMLRRSRRFFDERNVLEIDTPHLCDAAVSDPNIESVAASLALAPGRTFYLQTSPEFHMKRLLAAGFPDIYEICKVFRDGELGRQHQPEFTMVEWYRLGFSLDEMVAETVEFIETLLPSSRLSARAARMSYCEAFRRFANIDPLSADIAELRSLVDADDDLTASLGASKEAWLDLMMVQRIAPQFTDGRLTVIDHYPAAQAALARLSPDNNDVADRFEVFFGAIEIANGYVELTDAAEQRRRCQKDQAKRKSQGSPVRPIDAKLIAALDHGLPDCAGVAVGFDRLQIISAGTHNINSVRHFPLEAG